MTVASVTRGLVAGIKRLFTLGAAVMPTKTQFNATRPFPPPGRCLVVPRCGHLVVTDLSFYTTPVAASVNTCCLCDCAANDKAWEDPTMHFGGCVHEY